MAAPIPLPPLNLNLNQMADSEASAAAYGTSMGNSGWVVNLKGSQDASGSSGLLGQGVFGGLDTGKLLLLLGGGALVVFLVMRKRKAA